MANGCPPGVPVARRRARDLAALERVRASHRGGDAAAFDERYPRELWLEKAAEVLRTSRCLAERYGVSVDDGALSRELARMRGSSRAPERLEELFAALDHDPVRIKEGLVRPVLVDRLLRRRVSWDEEIQGAARAEASALAARLTPVTFEAVAGERLGRASYRLDDEGDSRPPSGGVQPVLVGPEELAELRSRFGPVGVISDPEESEDGITIRLVTEENASGFDALLVTVPKVQTEEWWREHGDRFKASLDGSLLARASPLPPIGVGPSGWLKAGGRDCPPAQGSWWIDAVPPESRGGHAAVWTGSEMIVWGGGSMFVPSGDTPWLLNTGGTYDPVTDAWAAITTEGAPSPRQAHTGVWTGSQLIVWGGLTWPLPLGGSVPVNDGFAYDPVSDSWTPLSPSPLDPRHLHTAIWTGSEMIVWGGRSSLGANQADGARYVPATDTWVAISGSGAPEARAEHTAIWTGSQMVIWGGMGPGTSPTSGGRYDPLADIWAPTSTVTPPPLAGAGTRQSGPAPRC